MQVSRISVYQPKAIYSKNIQRQKEIPTESTANTIQQDNPSFKAKFGAIVGGTIGGAAAVAAAAFVAPVAVCFIAGSAVVGAIGGDIAEDSINKKDD